MTTHRIIVGLAAAVLLATTVYAAEQISNDGGIKGDVRNETEIRKLYAEFAAAWNKHDGKAMADMWAIDGDHIDPDGRKARGRDEVTELMKANHETMFKDTVLDLNIQTVWFITGDIAVGDVALVDGSYSLAGIKGPDDNQLPTRSGLLTSVLTKQRGKKWEISASRLMIPVPLPWRRD